MRYLLPLSILFFALLLTEIVADSLGHYLIGWICKPLLMPTLLALFALNFEKNTKAEKVYFSVALVFSLLGDVLLMLQNNNLFVYGLGAFLVAHISFIVSFYSRITGRTIALPTLLISVLPFVLFVGSFLFVLIPHLQAKELTKPLVVPVSVYACVIGTMGFMALLRRGGVSASGFTWVMLGAVVFMVSDSCIAINSFISPLPQPTLLIMATYGIAQYLLTVGTLRR